MFFTNVDLSKNGEKSGLENVFKEIKNFLQGSMIFKEKRRIGGKRKLWL